MSARAAAIRYAMERADGGRCITCGVPVPQAKGRWPRCLPCNRAHYAAYRDAINAARRRRYLERVGVRYVVARSVEDAVAAVRERRTLVDLFAGAGGATAGYLAAGIDVVIAVDGWDVACEAHRRWHPSVPVHCGRVEDAHTLGVRAEFVHASPSCKPYSSANRSPKRGMSHPEYYPLAQLVSQAFDGLGARWLVIENVGGLLWSREGVEEIARFRAECERRRMPYTINVLNSNTCGVAQIRRRVFLVVGPRHVAIGPGAEFIPPVGVEEPLFVTAHDGKDVGWPRQNGRPRVAPTVEAGETLGRHRTRAERGICATPQGGKFANTPAERKVQFIGRTLAECAELQHVPMEILAGFTKRDAHALVGNCIPPPVAEHVARTILRADAEIGSGPFQPDHTK